VPATAGWPQTLVLETARRYADLGVHRLAIRPASADDTAVEDFIESVGETLVGRV
jgi:hypothetical protein